MYKTKKPEKLYKMVIPAVLLGVAILAALLWWFRLPRLPILTYHHILADGDSEQANRNDFVIRLEDFRAQMQYLRDNGYTTINSRQLTDYLYKGVKLPDKSVMITFDDGYYSNIYYAYPILKEYGLQGVIYSVTSEITKDKQEFNPLLDQYLSEVDMGETTDVFEFCSHTDGLHYLTSEGKPALTANSVETVREDMERSLSHPHLSPTSFSYPYGGYNSQTLTLLKEMGFEYAVTIKERYVTPYTNPYKLGRFTIYRSTSLEGFIKIVTKQRRAYLLF